MITLTKINNDRITVNAIYIERIESFPDTTITLTNQKKLFVKDTEEEVKEMVIQFYKEIGLHQVQREVGDQTK
ncbi:flagellar protein FlbD [Gracilibacillus boraciitolerans JCM 21714]|uniref:Flagellar protein FlbD n=1 Tax=Gracilibacillus boraciitolerans JCM 21714 TaxID=1298598 RepID=W4VFM2_9BACI|nr:flagellar FlbD family protein [Gracilibacillus boraciitolerans]GAE91623.1 flagellar protein FlbD [Gracilibacillus boraciitolerans JCM 21714]